MNTLHKNLGRLPYRYIVDSGFNDYQVRIECPAGSAIITEINSGEDYEIETSFAAQAVAYQHGYSTPRAALNRLINLNNIYLANRGVEPPPLLDPRRKVAMVLAAVVLSVIATLALLAAFSGSDSDGRTPSTSFTTSPGGTR